MALSRQAEELAEPEPGHRFFEVLGNLWHPRTNPKGYVNLGIAENSLMHEHIVHKINKTLSISEQNLTYGDNQAQLKGVVAAFLNRHFHPFTTIQPTQLSIVNGCTTALQNLSWALSNPEDIILIGRPFYGGIPMDVCRRTGVELVAIDTESCDPLGMQVLSRFEEEIMHQISARKRISSILLLHPHNPLGRCYDKTVLEAYMRLCDKYNLHLICNEIYALSTWQNKIDTHTNPKFQSILSISPQNRMNADRLHVLWGMSKDFGANGIRLGVTITRNKRLLAALQSVYEFSWTSSLTDVATINLLSDKNWVDWYLAENQRLLSAGHETVAKWAMTQHIEYEIGSNAGFFLWVNLGKKYMENHKSIDDLNAAIMSALLEQGVFLADGARFGSKKPGWFRIVFAHDAEYVDQGLSRITQALLG